MQSSELSYYVEELLPVAGVMRGLAKDCNRNGKEVQRKLFHTLEYQVQYIKLHLFV